MTSPPAWSWSAPARRRQVLTAENSTLSFATSTRLDPAAYTSPSGLLNNAGTDLLARMPGWSIWIVLLLSLYLLPRIGRSIDALLRWVIGKTWFKPAQKAEPTVCPDSVTAAAPTVAEAVQAGIAALGLNEATDVKVDMLQSPARPLFGSSHPARVRVSARLADE